ncbi:MAG: asparagine synthase-related protein [Cyanobacteria bacterium J06629_2]
MSAICGLVQRDGQPVATLAIEQTMIALEAYGKDGSAVWREDSAALGHQMLHITPESLHESLPWQDTVTGLVITADVRLDNREELFNLLDIDPQMGQKLSDSQLILRAYRKWGEQCPQRLLGDFAFAIWDSRQQKLFCARDIFGIKPFFFHRSPTRFVFASDLNALLKTSGVPNKYNKTLLAALLQQKDLRFALKSLTFYEEIYKLPPAHHLTLTPTEQKLQRYWSPEQAPKIRLNSESDYAEMLQELLTRSVSCRLRSAFPIGAHLSGGLDSSAIAVVAARVLRAEGKVLQGFSWSPPLTTLVDSPTDERNLVEELSDLEKIECHYVSLSGQDLLKYRTRNFFTEPTNMLQMEQKVQTEVSAQNIRMVLSGWGGDEGITFNGRGYFAELFLQGRWWNLYQELKLRGKLHGLGLKGQLWEKVILPLLPDALVIRLTNPVSDGYSFAGQSAYINHKFGQEVKSSLEQLPQLPGILREQAGVRANQRMLLENGHLTRRMEDWAISSGQNHFVYSYPLLDQRIVEFALGIPTHLFFKHGWKRYLFRSAMENLLPDSVRWNKSKVESATVAQIRSGSAEIAETWENLIRDRFQENSQSEQLAELIDLKKLEQALANEIPPQEGYSAALSFVANFTEESE